MKKSLISVINFLFEHWDYLKYWKKRSDLPNFDLYERVESKPNFMIIVSNFLKILAALLLAYLLPLLLFNHDSVKDDTDNFDLKIKIESPLFATIFWIFSGINFLYYLFKILKYQYRVSINQVAFLLFISAFCLILKDQKTLSITIYDNYEVINLVLLLVWIIIFSSLLNFYWPKYGKTQNTYIEDNPLEEDIELTEIEKKLLSKIKLALLKDKYKYSFSIGIIGPWGWGKSSFINRLKTEIKNYSETYSEQKQFYPITPYGIEMEKQRVITIEYSPFLNHSEENLIDDFFIQLSNNLLNYSSKLSKKVKLYAESLVDASENSIVKSLYQIATNSKKEASNEIYNEISQELSQLNLKIIIYVDDLDRLNPNEILQVLKLIRNTSNFQNFVFIVALDKEYVIRALKDLGDFTNRNFIDKFFQLECFLPEIEKEDIINATIDYINKKDLIKEKTNLLNTIRNELFLFTDYVQNYRDVKKFVNQLHFEYDLVTKIFDEILLPDYINMMLLKMKFPDYYRYILNNYENYFDNNNGILSLKEIPLNEKNTNIEEMVFDLQLIQNNRYILPDTKNYIFDDYLDCEADKKKYSCHESNLIKKTLILLFAKNSDPVPKSIRRISNLKKIAHLRLAKSDFTNEAFTALIEYYKLPTTEESTSRLANIETIESEGKLEQLITQLSFIYPEDLYTTKAVIILAFDILRVIKTQGKLSSKVQEIIEGYYTKENNFSGDRSLNNKIEVGELLKLFETNFIEAPEIDTLEKIDWINSLRQQALLNTTWVISNQSFQDFQLKLIQSEIKNAKDWKPNNIRIFTYFYYIYQSLNTYERENLNQMIKDFFKDSNLVVLFFNLLQAEYDTHMAFRLNDIINHVFGSTYNFIQFLKENHKEELDSFPEIEKFLTLNAIVDNKRHLKFNFTSDILVGHFNNWGQPHPKAQEDMKNSLQLFFESNLSTRGFDFSSIELRYNGYFYHSNGKDYWLFVSNILHSSKENFIDQVLNAFIFNFKSKHNLDCNIQIDSNTNYPFLIDQSNKIPLRIISIQ